MSNKKDFAALIKNLRKQGFTVEPTKKSHWKVIAPDGRRSHLPGSPSEYRGYQNALAQLKRLGFDPKKR